MSADWHILGPGAIGTLFACHMERAGLGVSLVFRTQREPVAVTLVDPRGDATFEFPAESARVGVDGRRGAIDRLLVTTKAGEALSALQSVAGRLSPGAVVILLHNGMGTVAPARGLLSGVDVYAGVTTHGANWAAPGRLIHAGAGVTQIGAPGEAAAAEPDWFADLALAGFTWDSEIDRRRWEKLFVNCAINPLTVVHQCRNGDLLKAPARDGLWALVAELQRLAAGFGFPEIAAALPETVRTVIETTADNYSSMLQDARAGRKTEIDFITGFLVRAAAEKSLDAPLSAALRDRVR